MMSDRVKSRREVQSNKMNIIVMLKKTCDLVKEVNEGRCC